MSRNVQFEHFVPHPQTQSSATSNLSHVETDENKDLFVEHVMPFFDAQMHAAASGVCQAWRKHTLDGFELGKKLQQITGLLPSQIPADQGKLCEDLHYLALMQRRREAGAFDTDSLYCVDLVAWNADGDEAQYIGCAKQWLYIETIPPTNEVRIEPYCDLRISDRGHVDLGVEVAIGSDCIRSLGFDAQGTLNALVSRTRFFPPQPDTLSTFRSSNATADTCELDIGLTDGTMGPRAIVIASVSSDTLRILRLDSKETSSVDLFHVGDRYPFLAFSSDDRWVAIAVDKSQDGSAASIALYDTTTRARPFIAYLPDGYSINISSHSCALDFIHKQGGGPYTAPIAVTSSGRVYVGAEKDGYGVLLRYRQDALRPDTLASGAALIGAQTLSVSPNGNLLAVGMRNKLLFQSTHSAVGYVLCHASDESSPASEQIIATAFTHDEGHMISARADSVALWSVEQVLAKKSAATPIVARTLPRNRRDAAQSSAVAVVKGIEVSPRNDRVAIRRVGEDVVTLDFRPLELRPVIAATPPRTPSPMLDDETNAPDSGDDDSSFYRGNYAVVFE